MNNKKFYARHKEVISEIAIFSTKQDRDKWVSFKDQFSIDVGLTSKNSAFQRVAQSFSQAYRLVGDLIFDEDNYIEDTFDSGIKWVEA